MAANGYVVDTRKPVTLDRVLFVFTSVLLLSHAVAYYVSLHTNGVETIIEDILLLLVGCALASVVVVRIIVQVFVRRGGQEWFISPVLLASVALLVTYPFIGAAAIFYALDQIRFHMDEGFYVTQVERSDSSPKFVIFDWGGTGFAAWRTNYFLVFDENNSIARGLANPMDMPLPNAPIECSTSVAPLYGSFYSVTVNCGPK